MPASDTLKRHVTALANLLHRMEPGQAKDRVERRLEETKKSYQVLRAKEERK